MIDIYLPGPQTMRRIDDRTRERIRLLREREDATNRDIAYRVGASLRSVKRILADAGLARPSGRPRLK